MISDPNESIAVISAGISVLRSDLVHAMADIATLGMTEMSPAIAHRLDGHISNALKIVSVLEQAANQELPNPKVTDIPVTEMLD